MAKVTKGVLKELLKECLKEIMEEEGVSFVKEGANIPLQEQNKSNRTNRSVRQLKEEKQNMLNEVLEENVKTLSNAVGFSSLGQKDGSQNIFEEIFKDTAMTTFAERQVHEGKAPPTQEMEERYEQQNQEEFEKLIGGQGDISRWAAVAFSKNNKK